MVKVPVADKAKISLFNEMLPKVLKIAGYPTIHIKKGDKTCTVCKKTYGRTGQLKDHVQKTHLGQGKHKCKQCEKSYIEKAMLEKHVEKEHQGKGVQCKVCGKKFISDKALNNHMPLHDPNQHLECPHSGNGCIQTFHVERYRDEHAGHCPFNPDREEFPCPSCTKVFYQRKQLNRHEKKKHKVAQN